MVDWNKAARVQVFRVVNHILKRSKPKTSVTIRNSIQTLKGFRTRFGYEDRRKLFWADDNGEKYFFKDMLRGFDYYRFGLAERGSDIARSYFVDKIDFQYGDVVIDCGGNYGDLYLYLRGKINSSDFHVFEPDSSAFEALELNVPRYCLHKKALSDSDEEKKFFVSSGSADSSLIQPSNYDSILRVPCTTISHFLELKKIGSVKLLKVEAEGYEPEVISGILESDFARIEYIAVDGGPERGVSKTRTLPALQALLNRHGFQKKFEDLFSGRALFSSRD